MHRIVLLVLHHRNRLVDDHVYPMYMRIDGGTDLAVHLRDATVGLVLSSHAAATNCWCVSV